MEDGGDRHGDSLVLSLPPDLKAAFEVAAENEGRSPSAIVSDLIGGYVRARQSEHDSWFRAQVASSMDDPRSDFDHETFMSEARQRLTDRLQG